MLHSVISEYRAAEDQHAVLAAFQRCLVDDFVLSKSTSGASAFNDNGLRVRENVGVQLWNQSDAVNKPSFTKLVTKRIDPSKIQSVSFTQPALYAVFQRWLWQEDGTWFVTDRIPPDPIFGPNQYFKDVAIFWFDKQNAVECGGTVTHLP